MVPPVGTLDYPPLTLGGRPAVKLSTEWRSYLTELERQSMAALERLSEQVEALQQRVEQQASQRPCGGKSSGFPGK